MRRHAVVAASVAALVASSTGCGGTGSDKAGGAPDGGPPTLTLAAYAQPDPDEFVAAVERLSQGSIRIDAKVLWRDGQDDYEQATIEDVRRGKVDLALVGARAFDLVGVTSFQGLLAPFLVSNLELQRRVLESPLHRRMLAGVERAGVVGLGVLPGPLRRPAGVDRPLLRVDEYRGALIGVRPSRLIERTFRALGASTKPAVFPGDFRVITGAEYELTALDFSRYDKPLSSLAANVVFWPRPVVLIANPKTFGGLESSERELLMRAASAALAPAFRRVEANEDSALRAVCARGDLQLLNATPSDLAALRSAVDPVYDELRRDPFTRRAIASIEALPGARVPETLRCPSMSVRPHSGSRVLDGTWEWSLTREELRAAGAGQAGDRLKGRWRLVLDRGEFELRNLDFGDAFRGSYWIEGNRLLARVAGTSQVGAHTWSLYRGRLTLGPATGSPPAVQMILKPLVRVR